MPSPKQTSSPQDPLSSHKRSRFWIFVFLILLLLFGGAYGLWIFLQQPVVGTVGVAGRALMSAEGKLEGPEAEKQYQGTYLTFTYPARYEEKERDNPSNGPIKESVFLSAQDIEGEKIALVVEERTERTLEASPAFQMRMNKPKEYIRKPLAFDGLEGFIFIKQTHVYEVTAFFRQNTHLVTVSVTSPFMLDGLEKTLFALLESLTWREEKSH